jgi:hypothetical protein
MFTVNSNCRYEATRVPHQVGMNAGSIVEGFTRKGADSSNVKPLIADRSMIGKEVTLAQLAKTHKINLEGDTLVLEKKARYCTYLVKLDTKDYGLPQTRNRKVRFLDTIVLCHFCK